MAHEEYDADARPRDGHDDTARVHPGWQQQAQSSYDAAHSGGWGGPGQAETGPLSPVSYTHLDVYKRQDEAWRTGQYGRVDLRVDDRRFFARAPGHPSTWWDRYRIARGRILLDRTDGAFTRDLGAWGRLTPAERLDAIDYYLDPYLTYSQRSLHAVSYTHLDVYKRQVLTRTVRTFGFAAADLSLITNTWENVEDVAVSTKSTPGYTCG